MSSISLLVLSALACGAAPDNVLLDFTATWCGPCQQMSPVVSRLHRQGYAVRKVDVDREPELARQFKISSIPAFVLVVNGREARRVVGATSEAELRNMLAMIPAVKEPPAVAVATTPNTTVDEGFQPAERAAPVVVAEATQSRLRLPFIPRPKDRVPQPQPVTREAAPREPVARAKLVEQAPISAEILNAGEPMTASTRIRITDKKGINFGSGTIIDSRVGNTLVLTCAHVFREFQQDSLVEVEVFINGKAETFVGKPVKYDFESDVGLISIPTDSPLPAAKIAPAGFKLAKGAVVQSIGCGGGDDPTRQKIRITALNRYRGPENIECTGVPQQGRSGGGLFTQEGHVIGVCTAADPNESRGLYAGLGAIHEMLEACQLARLYRDISTTEPVVAAAEATSDAPRFDETHFDETSATTAAPAEAVEPAPRHDASLAAIQNAFQDADDFEVVCIIRPRKGSGANSRVVVLNKATPQFVEFLSGEMNPPAEPKTTTLKVPAETPSDAPAFRTSSGFQSTVASSTDSAGPRPYRRTK